MTLKSNEISVNFLRSVEYIVKLFWQWTYLHTLLHRLPLKNQICKVFAVCSMFYGARFCLATIQSLIQTVRGFTNEVKAINIKKQTKFSETKWNENVENPWRHPCLCPCIYIHDTEIKLGNGRRHYSAAFVSFRFICIIYIIIIRNSLK